MTSNKEEIQKKERKRRMQEQLEQIKSEEEMKKSQPVQYSVPKFKPDEEEKQAIDNRAILKEYRKKFPKRNIVDNYKMYFKSAQEAQQFFKESADKKIPFLAFKVDKNGKPTGNYYMSKGDGKLIEGKVEPDKINDVINDYENEMKPTPEYTSSGPAI